MDHDHRPLAGDGGDLREDRLLTGHGRATELDDDHVLMSSARCSRGRRPVEQLRAAEPGEVTPHRDEAVRRQPIEQ
jgi:hypothetical protein